jgi:uncharacterized protein YciI/GNAT superfamily N-acetyltransferase
MIQSHILFSILFLLLDLINASRAFLFLTASARPTTTRDLSSPTSLAFSLREGNNKMSLSDIDSNQLDIRKVTAEDIPRCYEIEEASYPADEAASKENLILRQREAGPFFRALISEGTIIGFVCSTLCKEFTEESMSRHDPDGDLLAIHSVVVEEKFRRKGLATAMLKHYVKTIQAEHPEISSMVLLAKSHLLGFYVNCGFQVLRPSPIVHGQELWYDLELKCKHSSNIDEIRSLPNDNESWFVKTEQFKKPFPEVRPHLEAHREWVKELRANGYCVTSGYRVDSEGKPGPGGLMFLAAKSYEEAMKLVSQDPLIANDCVDWELAGWIGEVGNVQMR